MIIVFIIASAESHGFVYIQDWENHKINLEFRQDSEERIFLLERSIESSNLIVESLKSLYAASRDVERQEFQAFVQPLLSRNPFIQALEWIPRVDASERTSYEKAAQLDGFPDFQITEMKAQGEMIRATLRDKHFPVYFVEPFRGNKSALGFDLLSNPKRKEALI